MSDESRQLSIIGADSAGGPYQDESFGAGWVCGEMHTWLKQGILPGRRKYPLALLPQIIELAEHHDCVAMVYSAVGGSADVDLVRVHLPTPAYDEGDPVSP